MLAGTRSSVRKHRAPNSALRLGSSHSYEKIVLSIRKHRAPKGALRPIGYDAQWCVVRGQKAPSAKRRIKTPRQERTAECARVHRQKAPSAKRCIKTDARAAGVIFGLNSVRKHRAPKGALRRGTLEVCGLLVVAESERTERQKVN